MMAPIMKIHRLILVHLLLALSLLFAQQVGAAHALHHALENLAQQQEDKQSPTSNACEKCDAYAQLGSALNVGTYDLALLQISNEIVEQRLISSRSIPSLASVARGPPHTSKTA